MLRIKALVLYNVEEYRNNISLVVLYNVEVRQQQEKYYSYIH
jgi:hypothetical protein